MIHHHRLNPIDLDLRHRNWHALALTAIMSNEDHIAALRGWLLEQNGFLHESVKISSDDEHGLHLCATNDIPCSTKLIDIPHSLTLSCLNAMVDDAHPEFRDHADEFTVEALGFFYLASQYIDIETSFWRPYLKCLPTPESLNTPFWFEDHDLQWLRGTDVHQAFIDREKIWRKYWEDGLEVMRRAGVNTKPYTWLVLRQYISAITDGIGNFSSGQQPCSVRAASALERFVSKARRSGRPSNSSAERPY